MSVAAFGGNLHRPAAPGRLPRPALGTPPRLSDLAAATGQDLASVRETIGQLVAAGIATIDVGLYGDPAVTGAEGLTVKTTPHQLLVDGQALPARAYLIANGAEPTVSDLPGLADVAFLTSTTAMELKELPESLVVGGGYVGMEMAQLFAHLSTKVTIVGRLAPRAEPELASRLRKVFLEDSITVVRDRAASVEHDGDNTVVVTESGRRLPGQRLLMAVGRNPRTATLNLPAAGVETDERGFVVVDAHQRTSNPRVFAAGDVSGAPQYVYVAAAGGKVAAINALGGSDRLDYTGLPAVTFTRPQLASAGLTEAVAVERGHRCACRLLDVADVPRALANRDTRGAIKLVADADTGKVLGAHALADGAGEMMLAATYAIKAGFTVDDLAITWAPYLTMAEGLRIAAGLFGNRMPTSCCA